jgi:hypothetical protein
VKTQHPHPCVRHSILRRVGILALSVGAATAAAPAAALTPAHQAVATPQTVFCSVNEGTSGIAVYCGGEGAVSVTLVCTTGTSYGFFFAPGNATVVCPPGGTVIRFQLYY